MTPKRFLTPNETTSFRYQLSEFARNTSLAILPNCDAKDRCANWIGPLNGNNKIGCGINALAFLGEIEGEQVQSGLHQAQNTGTPFKHIVDWFNNKIQNIDKTKRFIETKYDINTLENLERFFNIMCFNLGINTCTIVKYNRDPDANKRPANLTPGHYVILHKDINNKIITYEPIYSTQGTCNTRQYKGVSKNFFNAFQQQGYLTVSVLSVIKIQTGGNKVAENNEENIKPYLMPDNIFDELSDALKPPKVCVVNGSGKTKKNKTYKRSKKTKKNKTYKRSKKTKNRFSKNNNINYKKKANELVKKKQLFV